MTVLTSFSNGASLKDYRDTFNAMLVDIATLKGATPKPTVTISAAQSKAEGNSGATLFTYTVTRSVSSGAVTVPWSFTAGATSANDFTGGTYPAGGNLALADGIASGTFSVSVNGDTTVEADEQFTVMISTPTGYVAGTATSATGTILNDDPAAPTGFYANGASNAAFKSMLTRVRAGTGRGRIVYKGCSTSMGAGAGDADAYGGVTNGRFKRVPSFIAQSNVAGVAALDSAVCGDHGFANFASNANPGTFVGYDTRVALTNMQIGTGQKFAGGGLFNNAGSGGLSFQLTATDTDTFEIILYGIGGGADWNVTIDSAAPAAGPAVLSYTGTNNSFKRYTVKAASAGTRTLRLTSAGSNAAPIRAIIPSNSTKPAIDFVVHASAGAMSADQANQDASVHWNGGDAGIFDAPDFTIIEACINDIGSAVGVSASQTAVQSMIDQAKTNGGGVFLIAPHPAGGNFSTNADSYHSMWKALAASNGIPFFSLYEYYGSAFTAAFRARMYQSNDVHGGYALQVEEAGLIGQCLQFLAA